MERSSEGLHLTMNGHDLGEMSSGGLHLAVDEQCLGGGLAEDYTIPTIDNV